MSAATEAGTVAGAAMETGSCVDTGMLGINMTPGDSAVPVVIFDELIGCGDVTVGREVLLLSAVVPWSQVPSVDARSVMTHSSRQSRYKIWGSVLDSPITASRKAQLMAR